MKKIITWIGDLFRLLTRRIYTILEVIAVNFYSIVLLIVLYAFYWQFDQAQDLLLTLNQEKHWQVMLFFFTLTNLAAICWYMPKYLYPENEDSFHQINSTMDFIKAKVNHHSYDALVEEEAAANRREYNTMVPRFMGTAVLLIVALGILNMANEVDPDHFRTPASLLLAFFGFAFLMLLLVSRNEKTVLTKVIETLKYKMDKKALWLYFFFIIIGVILGILAWYNQGSILQISSLVIGSLLIALAFFVFTVFRSHLPFFKEDKNIIALIIIVSILSSLAFLVININPSFSQNLNPLICANLAFILYLSVFYWFRIVGKRKKVYLVTLLLIGTAVLFFSTSSKQFYQVKYVDNMEEQSTTPIYPVENRVSLANYFKTWVDHRKDHIAQVVAEKGYYPVFVSASEGGGSRAAYWTSISYGYIQNQVPEFYDQHLFALTGASGGITGSSTFFSMKEGGLEDQKIHESARKMFRQNFLSGTLTRLLGFDLWQEILGLNLIDNRAIVLQEEWAEELEKATGITAMSQPYLSFWYQKNTTNLVAKVPPLLLINTTFVQRGNHAVFSPVIFDSTFYRGYDLLGQIDKVTNQQKTVQVNTATVLNASFPYICPAGFVEETGNFVDAGYYDNLGAQTAIGVLRQLEAVQAELQKNPADSLYAAFKFIGVQVRNDLSAGGPSNKVTNYQLNAPLVAFSKISSGYVEYDEWNYSETGAAFYQINLTQEDIFDGQDTIKPIIPLARYLSPLAIEAMDASLRVQAADVDSDLNGIVREMK